MMALRTGMYVLTEEQFKPYREAYEKQIPKKPKFDIGLTIDNDEVMLTYCAICNGNLYEDDNYCCCCGQAIDWSDDE